MRYSWRILDLMWGHMKWVLRSIEECTAQDHEITVEGLQLIGVAFVFGVHEYVVDD